MEPANKILVYKVAGEWKVKEDLSTSQAQAVQRRVEESAQTLGLVLEVLPVIYEPFQQPVNEEAY